MFNVNDRVKIGESRYSSELVNTQRAGKTGTVTEISFPFGLHIVYKIVYDEPIQDRWGIERYFYCYEKENCLTLLNETQGEDK